MKREDVVTNDKNGRTPVFNASLHQMSCYWQWVVFMWDCIYVHEWVFIEREAQNIFVRIVYFKG